MSRYFVILGTMRTGSNFLETTLAQFPDLVCHGEAYNPAFIGKPRAHDLLGWTREQRDADPLGFLAHMRAEAGAAIPGFRLFAGHSQTILDHVIADPDCALIVLSRDPVESWVSLRIAQTTDQWILRNTERRLAARVWFDAAALERYAADLRAFYADLGRSLLRAGRIAFAIDYAELGRRDLIEGLGRFIGAPRLPARLEPQIARQNPGALTDKLENPDDYLAWRGGEQATALPARAPEIEAPRVVRLADGGLALCLMPGGEALARAVLSGFGETVEAETPPPGDLTAAIVIDPARQARGVVAQCEALAAAQARYPIERLLRAERLEAEIAALGALLGRRWTGDRTDLAVPNPATREMPDDAAALGY